MELQAKVEYALIALMELASHTNPHEPLQIKQIAEKQGIPNRYLEQVFASLKLAGIIRSQRGNKGGYLLARQPWQVTLLEVSNCLSDSKTAKAPEATVQLERSIVRDVWKEARQNAANVLQGYTIQDLCQQRQRQQFNTMYYI